MFIKQKNNVIFRNYNSFGYITDNRNFGYDRKNNGKVCVGDKILSESGAVFFSVLDRKPQPIDGIIKKIARYFSGVDIETIKNDAIEFYCMLEHDGFVVSGETPRKCAEKDTGFSYKTLKTGTKNTNSLPAKALLEKSTQDFLEEHFNGKPQLTSLHIEITSRCNERCTHCYIPHEKKISDMGKQLFCDILKQCKDMRLLHLTLSGGEPMLHKNFCEFIRICRNYNFSVNILSNLTLLTNEILKEMKKNTLLGVQVSLYSMTPRIHDGITNVKGSFEKTKSAILKLIENDIPLQISCPIMRQNKNSYADVIEWAAKHNVHAISDFVIIARYDHTTQNLKARLSINEVKDVIRYNATSDPEYFERLEVEAKNKASSTPSDFICSVCNSTICIAEDGSVYPCAGWQSYTVGNVNEAPLRYIWDNSLKIQYLRGLRRKDFSKCIHCDSKDYCTMCMVRNANESSYGDLLTVNEYFCEIAKFNRALAREWKEKNNISKTIHSISRSQRT